MACGGLLGAGQQGVSAKGERRDGSPQQASPSGDENEDDPRQQPRVHHFVMTIPRRRPSPPSSPGFPGYPSGEGFPYRSSWIFIRGKGVRGGFWPSVYIP